MLFVNHCIRWEVATRSSDACVHLYAIVPGASGTGLRLAVLAGAPAPGVFLGGATAAYYVIATSPRRRAVSGMLPRRRIQAPVRGRQQLPQIYILCVH